MESINWWVWDSHKPPMGWFIFDFLVFIGLLVYVSRKPLRRYFLIRHERIKQAVGEAAAAHALAQARYTTGREKVANLEIEARETLKQSVHKGQEEAEHIIGDAKLYAAQLQEDSLRLIQQEEMQMQRNLQQTLARNVLQRARVLLDENLTDADKQQLLTHAIAHIGQIPAQPNHHVIQT